MRLALFPWLRLFVLRIIRFFLFMKKPPCPRISAVLNAVHEKKDFHCPACPVWLCRVVNWRTPTLGSKGTLVFQGFCATYTKCHNWRDVFSAAELLRQMPPLRKPCSRRPSVKACWNRSSVVGCRKKLCWSLVRWPDEINVRETRRRWSRRKLSNSSPRFKVCFVADELWVDALWCHKGLIWSPPARCRLFSHTSPCFTSHPRMRSVQQNTNFRDIDIDIDIDVE